MHERGIHPSNGCMHACMAVRRPHACSSPAPRPGRDPAPAGARSAAPPPAGGSDNRPGRMNAAIAHVTLAAFHGQPPPPPPPRYTCMPSSDPYPMSSSLACGPGQPRAVWWPRVAASSLRRSTYTCGWFVSGKGAVSGGRELQVFLAPAPCMALVHVALDIWLTVTVR
jgi:hypothetical protein